jgi:3-hydroxyacyl-[acyl-carrier-protein] dehydratase
MNTEEIKRILPHRDPMLLVDEVLGYVLLPDGHESIVATKIITGDEHILKGHFPGNPIWPGIYTVEGFAQSAGILLYLMADYKNIPIKKLGYFSGIDKARFSGLIVPGDTIKYTVNFLWQKRNFYSFACEAHVKTKRVARAEIKIVIP